jgi:two-component system cell cycle sensor histidine kinase/response regulator CckA
MPAEQILVVEDEVIVAKDLQNELKSLGYDVPFIASSGEEAIEKAAATRPNLVLMDIRLKGQMDGVDAAHELRRRLNIPVVFLTAYADESTLQRAKVAEPYGYLLKPFERRELRISIETALHKHKMEQKVQQKEQWLTAVLWSIGDGVIVADKDGVVTFINPVAELLTGWKRQEAVGKRLPEILRIVGPAQQTVEHPVMRVLREGEVVHIEDDFDLLTKSGEKIEVDDSAAPLKDANGNISGVVVVFSDATERRAYEEELRRAHKMEAVRRVAGGMAHDFNNLLSVITGYSEFLLGHFEESDPLRKHLDKIHRAGASLTRQLLVLGSRQLLQPEILDVKAVISDMEMMLRLLAGQQVDVLIKVAPDLGHIKADQKQIEQIIMNLSLNALDAMPNGGRLIVEASNIILDRSYVRRHVGVEPGEYVMLTVSDTGCGMDTEVQSHLFEPFFTTKDETRGTGMDLSAVYGIVRQSGGHIDIESEPGKGSTFMIYFPRVEDTAPARAAIPGLIEMPRRPETVLLVEDEEGVRSLLRKMLRKRGYTVLDARDGSEALFVSKEHQGPIHLLLTDVVMPKMNGWELAKRLSPLRPEMKVLFMSGYTDDAIVRHSMSDAATAFIQKPFTPDALVEKVSDVLGQ